MAKLRGASLWMKLLDEQREWVAKCGGDLEGYIANYHGTHGRSVENATAIYNADMAELRRREDRLASYAGVVILRPPAVPVTSYRPT